MTIRVVDLDDFSLSHIWRPYWRLRPEWDGTEAHLTAAPMDLKATARELRVEDSDWGVHVIDRLARCGVEFPEWIQHPLQQIVQQRVEAHQFHLSIPKDLDTVKAEAVAAVRDQAWRETNSDEEEITRLKELVTSIANAERDRSAADMIAEAEARPCRHIVHVVAGGFGADWDADAIVASIGRAKSVRWRYARGTMRPDHELVIEGDPDSFEGHPFVVGVNRPGGAS